MHGVVLADQIKSLDWRGRNATFAATLPGDSVREVFEKASALIDPDGGTQEATEG